MTDNDVTSQDWALRVSRAEAFEFPVNEPDKAFAFAHQLEKLTPQARDVLRRLGDAAAGFLWVVQYALAELIWDVPATRQTIETAIAAVPPIIAAAYDVGNSSPAAFQFWDSVLDPLDRMPWLRNGDYRVDLISHALIEQLRSTNSGVQVSALHGINHLRDQGTADVAATLVSGLSEEGRAYAEGALRFRRP